MSLTEATTGKAAEDISRFLKMLDGAVVLRDALSDMQRVLQQVAEKEVYLSDLTARCSNAQATLEFVKAECAADRVAADEYVHEQEALVQRKLMDLEALNTRLVGLNEALQAGVKRRDEELTSREQAVATAEQNLAVYKKKLQGIQADLERRENELNERASKLRSAVASVGV